MRVELEDNLQNNLSKFFKEVNKYAKEFDGIRNLLEYISKRLERDGFKCHQQFSFSLKNTMIIFNRVEYKNKYINNLTINTIINIIIEEENLKVVGVTKSETKTYNEIIF